MTLPDFTSQMFGYVNTILAWSPLLAFLGAVMAMATVAVIVSLLMRAMMRG